MVTGVVTGGYKVHLISLYLIIYVHYYPKVGKLELELSIQISSNLSNTSSPAFGFLIIPTPHPVTVVPVWLEVVNVEKYLQNFPGVRNKGIMIISIGLCRRGSQSVVLHPHV